MLLSREYKIFKVEETSQNAYVGEFELKINQMKTTNIILLAFSILSLTSCYDQAKIQVKNNISNVKISNIKWGDNFIIYEHLSGETSSKVTINEISESLPARHHLKFVMSANNKSMYFETEEAYMPSPDEGLLIVLTDSTKINKMNE